MHLRTRHAPLRETTKPTSAVDRYKHMIALCPCGCSIMYTSTTGYASTSPSPQFRVPPPSVRASESGWKINSHTLMIMIMMIITMFVIIVIMTLLIIKMIRRLLLLLLLLPLLLLLLLLLIIIIMIIMIMMIMILIIIIIIKSPGITARLRRSCPRCRPALSYGAVPVNKLTRRVAMKRASHANNTLSKGIEKSRK